MSMLCRIGMHKWKGCKCDTCSKTRDQEHDWTKDCEKCAICGETRKDRHRLQGCQCTVCGSEVHSWAGEKKIKPMVYSHSCRRCGKTEQSVMIDPSSPDDLEASLRFLGLR